MNCSRALLLASLLLIPAGFGCGKKGGSGEGADGKPGLTKDKILGAWLLEKTDSDGAPGKDVWEFKGGGYEYKATYKLKTVSARELVLGQEKDPDLKYKRKGAAPAGKSKRDKLVGRWDGQLDYQTFTKDGKWVQGAKAQDEHGKSIDVELYWGTFTLNGDRLTVLQKGDGLANIKEQGMDFTSAPWEMQGDKLTVAGSLMGKFNYTLKTDGDNRLVLVDPKGKKRQFTRQVGPSGVSKQDLIVGTWDVVKSETGLDPGNRVTFTKDGKYTAEVGGIKLGGTYKVEGDTLKQVADGSKLEVAKTIRTLTATALVTEDAIRKVDELKKK